MYVKKTLCPLLKLCICCCDVKVSKTLITFIFSGNSFNMSQFRRNCKISYVLIVKTRENIE